MFAFCMDIIRIMPTDDCGDTFNFTYLCLLQGIRWNKSLALIFICINIILKRAFYSVEGRKHEHWYRSFLWTCVILSVGAIPKNRISASCGNIMFN